VVETPKANLSAGMQWLLGTYTSRFNRRHRLFGHLFSGRFKCLIVDGSGNGYLKSVCDYVHLNPIRACLISAEQPLEDYQWSSYPQYLETQPAPWLRTDRLLGEWGIAAHDAAGRQQFRASMEQRRELEVAKQNGDWARLRRGPENFRRKLLDMVDKNKGKQHYGEEMRESDEQKANRLLEQLLRETSLHTETLVQKPKGHPQKVLIASRLRNETTMTWQWITERLQMGHWRSAANAVRAATQRTPCDAQQTFSHL